MTKEADKGIINHLQKYWSVYSFIAYMIVGWVLLGARTDQIEYRITKVEAEQAGVKTILLQLQLDTAVIKSNVEDIKKKVQ